MAQIGQCTNYTGCTLAARNELFTIPDGAPFVCPQCGRPLAEGDFLTRKGRTIFPVAIVGGLALLTLLGIGGVYLGVKRMHGPVAAGQIGTSFEQAEIAAAKGEFPLSRRRRDAAALDGTTSVIAYTQFSVGDTLGLAQTQLQLATEVVRYRSGMPDDKMSMVYFLNNGNLHVDVTKLGDTWVLESVPVLELAPGSVQDRVNAWDTGSDRQRIKYRSTR